VRVLVCLFLISFSLVSAAKSSLMLLSSIESHIWLNLTLLRTKMRSLEATNPESMRARGELSFLKLFSCQILHEENRRTRPLHGSWRNLAGINIDVVLPYSSLIAGRYSWGLVPGSYTFKYTDPWNQTTGRIHPSTIPSQAITFSPWAFFHSFIVWGFEGAHCWHICLFGDRFRTNHFSSNRMTLWNHCSSIIIIIIEV